MDPVLTQLGDAGNRRTSPEDLDETTSPTPPSYWLYHSFIMVPKLTGLVSSDGIHDNVLFVREVHVDYCLSHDTCVHVNDGVFLCRQMV